jgi:HK97 family phage prohead protease
MEQGLERRPYGWDRRAVVAGTKSHPLIRGTAIVFDQRSTDLGGFVEVIRPEAFKRTLNEGIDLRAFFGHDPDKVLGRQSVGTLQVHVDHHGVHVEIDPPSPPEPPNLLQSIERGDISGMSFSFQLMPGGDEVKRENNQVVRYVEDMRVFEVSVVSMPAYEQTSVDVTLRARFADVFYPAPRIADLHARAEARARAWAKSSTR